MKKRAAPAGNSEAELGLTIETPGHSARTPISVTDLTAAIRDLLESGLGEVWVAGEISNFRSPGSGHLYFTLKDASATLSAVMFQREARRVGFALQDGQAVLARGTITVYEARGQYQIQVAELRPRGQGGLQQRFEELKQRLQLEGLFALERKRPLPVFPEAIGIVTSLQGAVLQDMLHILKRRAPGLRIRVRGVRVQGMGAAQEIVDAIAAFNSERNVDLLVVARGGGSLEDLWAFNEEIVARALVASHLPTISAVGHETDFTIADFVADMRAPTPSAAAEIISRDWSEWRQTVAGLQARMERIVRHALTGHRRHLAQLASSYALREPRRVVRQWIQRVDDLAENLFAGTQNAIQSRKNSVRLLEARLKVRHPSREIARHREHLAHLAARLRTLGPQATLDRGYALVLDPAHRPVMRAAPSLEGRPVRIILSKGTLQATVKEVRPQETLIETLAPLAPGAPAPKKNRARRKPAS